jgi:hypothetical protein
MLGQSSGSAQKRPAQRQTEVIDFMVPEEGSTPRDMRRWRVSNRVDVRVPLRQLESGASHTRGVNPTGF